MLFLLQRRHANNVDPTDARPPTWLSKPALRAVESGEVSEMFVRCFRARHPHVDFKTPASLETQRAQRSTKETRDEHGRRLQAWLQSCGMLNPDGSLKLGELWRLCNMDEMPQPVNSGSAAGSKKAFGNAGTRAKAQIQRQSENLSVMPVISADGTKFKGGVVTTQIIFKTAASDLDKAKITVDAGVLYAAAQAGHNINFNSTAKSYQTGSSLVHLLQNMVRVLAAAGLTPTADRPLCLTTDGHKSRFGVAAMEFCIANNISVYLLPPHASTLFQPLDQLFAALHVRYGVRLKAWKAANMTPGSAIKPTPSRGNAVEILVKVIADGWFNGRQLGRAWDNTGFYRDGVDVARAVPDSKCLPSESSNTAAENLFVNDGFVDHNPAVQEPAPKSHAETPLEFALRLVEHWKATALRLAATPRSAREIGALPLPSGTSKADADAFAAMEGNHGKADIWGQMDLAKVVALKKATAATAEKKATAVAAELHAEAPVRFLLFALGYIVEAAMGSKIVGTTHLAPFFRDNNSVLKISETAVGKRVVAVREWICAQGVDVTTGAPGADAAAGVLAAFYMPRIAPAADKLQSKPAAAPGPAAAAAVPGVRVKTQADVDHSPPPAPAPAPGTSP